MMRTDTTTYFEQALEQIKEISERIFKQGGARVILFGSRANGNFKRNSDIDIVLQNVSRYEKALFTDSVENSNIIYTVDVSLWEDLPELFRQQIEKEGKIIWERV